MKIKGYGTGRAGNSDSRWNASMSAYIRRLWVTFRHLNKNPGDFPLPRRSFFLSRWSRSRVDLKSVAKGGPPHFAWYYLAPRVISLVLPLLLTFSSFYSPCTSPMLFVSLWPPRGPLHCILLWSRARDLNSRNARDYDFRSLFWTIFTGKYYDIFIND